MVGSGREEEERLSGIEHVNEAVRTAPHVEHSTALLPVSRAGRPQPGSTAAFSTSPMAATTRTSASSSCCVAAAGRLTASTPAAGKPAAALGDAIALARSELGVEVEINPTNIKLDEEGYAEDSCAVGVIKHQGKVVGRLVYAPTVLTHKVPWDVRPKEADPCSPTTAPATSSTPISASRPTAPGRHAGQRARQAMRTGTAATVAVAPPPWLPAPCTPMASSTANALAVRHGHVARVRQRPAHAEHVARRTEQPADVAGQVREEVARVGVLGDAPAGQRCLEAVDRATAVGVDQAPCELAGMPTIISRRHGSSTIRRSCCGLGRAEEGVQPGLPRLGRDTFAPRGADEPGLKSGHRQDHRSPAVIDDPLITEIERPQQHPAAMHHRHPSPRHNPRR